MGKRYLSNNQLKGYQRRKQKHQHVPKDSKPWAKKISSLSDLNYSVYIIYMNEKVGYLGVYPNGNFNYSIIKDDVDENQILCFINEYISNKHRNSYSTKEGILK